MDVPRRAQPDRGLVPAQAAGGHARRAGARETRADALTVLDLLPSPDAGPEAARMRAVLIERLRQALDELPADQRLVFVAHEVDGMSFKAIAAQTGENLNTLLSRKRYAVLQLRERLQDVFDELRTSRGNSS